MALNETSSEKTEEKDWQEPAELAPHYKCSGATIRRWIRQGCPARKIGRKRVLVRKVDVDAWLATAGGAQ